MTHFQYKKLLEAVLDMSKIINLIDFDAYLVFVLQHIFKKNKQTKLPLKELLAVFIHYHWLLQKYIQNTDIIFFLFICINLFINLSPTQNY